MTATEPPSTTGSPTAVYRWGFALAALLIALLLVDNWQYLFRTPLYESSDWAANSLLVREAKDHPLLHGHYSRWNFYHPGPVLFYTYALGEELFYNLLHVVPTPYNGQVIALCVAVTLFFSFALAVFARRLGAERGAYRFFLPLALLFAVWHYGAANVAPVFMETWPACTPVLVFLCLVVTTASVASGGGWELPLVALSGGWLVHNHVAQPLFVVPMTLLAYGGLLAWCRQTAPAGRPQGWRGTLTAGWRRFPRAHVVAVVIVAVFCLPIVIDVVRDGSNSNFNRILTHIHRHHEPLHKFSRSVCYFLTFGAYSFYDPAEIFFGKYTTKGMLAFVALHWRAYLGWIAVLAAVPVLFGVAHRTRTLAPTADSQTVRRSTFIPWFYVMTLLACALTLFWGMKQDGEMYYFNADFNYSIYYCAALGLAAALSAFLQAVLSAPHLRLAQWVGSAAIVLAAVVAALSNTGEFQLHSLASPADRAAAQTVTEAAAATLPRGSICYLDCDPWDAWPTMIGAALQLDRLGYKVRVNDNLAIMFGERRVISHEPVDDSRPVVRWMIVPIKRDPARLGRWPLLDGYGIDVESLADLNPGGGVIRFANDGNWRQYAVFGWAMPEGDWTWTEQPEAMLQFRPLPLPPDNTAGVDMVIDAWCFASPTAPVAQHLETVFGGTALPTVPVRMDSGRTERVKLHIDAEVWRAASARGFVEVVFRFPDAKSPYSLGLSDDARQLGLAFRTIEFHPAP